MSDMIPTTSADLTDDATAFEVADRLALLKRMENDYKARRIAAEARLCSLLKFPECLTRKGAKSKTFPLKDDQSDAVIRVTLKKNVTLKLEPADLEAIRDHFDADELPVRVKEEVDAEALKRLDDANPDLGKLFRRAVVSVPGKTGVSFPKD